MGTCTAKGNRCSRVWSTGRHRYDIVKSTGGNKFSAGWISYSTVSNTSGNRYSAGENRYNAVTSTAGNRYSEVSSTGGKRWIMQVEEVDRVTILQ